MTRTPPRKRKSRNRSNPAVLTIWSVVLGVNVGALMASQPIGAPLLVLLAMISLSVIAVCVSYRKVVAAFPSGSLGEMSVE